MASVRAKDLPAGSTLPHALYTRSRRLLAHRGTTLTPEMIEALSAAGEAELFYDTRAEPLGLAAPSEEPASTRGLREPEDQTAVLASVGGASRLNVQSVDPDRWERRLLRARAELRREAPALVRVAQQRWSKMPLSIDVGADPVPIGLTGWRPPAEVPCAAERDLRARRAAGVSAIRAAFERLLDGHPVSLSPLEEAADDLIDALIRHAAIYSVLALGLPSPVDALPEHAYSTGATAAAIAARLGWPRREVRLAAMAGFIADAGLALVPHPVRLAPRALDDVEVNAVRRHTEYTVALARRVRSVDERAVLAAYQHHERCDGSGYPLGIKARQMHDLSRVLAAADMFAAMTSPRSHRPPLLPRAALSELAAAARTGALDAPVVRALVDVVGLYPAGSYVRLSSGHIALVGAAAPAGASDRPVVHIVQPTGAPAPFGRPIDLARIEPKTLRVVEAVRAATAP